jgi:hypothetical protein
MLPIEKRYVTDENGRRVAVQIDLATFERIEDVLEDYALAHLMREGESEEALSATDARAFYDALPKTE